MRNFFGLTLIIMSLVVSSCSRNSGSEATEREQVPTLSSVRDIGRLELAEMTISKMGTIDDLQLSQAKGLRQTALALFNKMKIGERKGAYSYDTYMRAYIDMNSLTDNNMSVDTAARTVTLRLPEIQTELAGRDVSMREEHYRVTGLRSNISAAERAQLKEEMNNLLRKEVASNKEFVNELKRQAESKAESYFNALFGSMGYTVNILR